MQTQNSRLLTVSMPNYNHALYLPQRISSLLAAMPDHSELVIVDDGSTDGSVEIIQKFAMKDSRVVFIQNQKNEGVNFSLQKILEVASGTFISFQSADDFIFPNFFSKLLDLADKYSDYAIYTSDFGYCHDIIPEDLSQIQSDPLIPYLRHPCVMNPNQVKKALFESSFWVPGHSSLIRRGLVMKFGGFNPILKQHADWFLIHAIALTGGVAYLPETLSVWRLDKNSFTNQEMKDKVELKKTHMNLFRNLRRKEMRNLRILFRNSTAMRAFMRRRLCALFLRPAYWDFLLYYAASFIYKRVKLLLPLYLDRKVM